MLAWIRNRRRRKIRSQPWPDTWSEVLHRNVRHVRRLDAVQASRLHDRAKIFIAEKNWEAASGLTMSDEIRVTIAGQAALMLLGVDDFYFDNVSSVIVYPGAFGRDHYDGVVTGRRRHAGEAWQGGPVILSWQDVLSGGQNDRDGKNLIFHEFAHTLDGIDGEMGGSLMFDDREKTRRWELVSRREFLALCRAADTNQRTLLDQYGANNEAEFFAVACEAFFEQPDKLKSNHDELFELLVSYYRLDPRSWQRTVS